MSVYRLRQRLTEAGVRQAEIIVHVLQGQLLAHALLVLAQRGDASAKRGHMLAQAEVEAVTVKWLRVLGTAEMPQID